MKKPGLGRGLSALLDDQKQGQSSQQSGSGEGIEMLSLTDIRPNPDQPRKDFNEESLDQLAESIRSKGVLQPILVRRFGNGYEIIAGERRWRAAQRAQLHQIPALIRDINEQGIAEVALIENVQREDLNVLDEAAAYRALATDYGHDQATIGKIVGKSRSHVANLIRLLDLPDAVREHVREKRLTMGHARAVLAADDPEALANRIVKEDLTVRQAEAMAKGRGAETPKKETRPLNLSNGDMVNADVEALERQLGDMLGLKVEIGHGKAGGKVQLRYRTLDQLDMICQRLSGDKI